MNISIRHYRTDGPDRQQINDVCCDAALLGAPIDSIFQDREWFTDFMVAPYLLIEPEHTWVAEADNRVVGYLTGSVGVLFGIQRAQLALLAVDRLLWKHMLGKYKHHPRSQQFVRFVLTEALLQVPAHPSHAGHFHFNVAEGHRGQGIGSHLIAEFERVVMESGLRRYYAEVMCWGEKQEAYYTRLGYRIHGHPISATVFATEVPDLRIMCIVKDLADSTVS
ncbi:MAG: GNAT family N-acetyltransferase [Candidatus Methylophosphatis roskildensis]|nr:GNAT family N-acetyltransferase [Sterolibacteriaceae bacterium]MBK9085879.1 GNAT family N-acetyltransferase [Sterolibacteriaceae bacterium]